MEVSLIILAALVLVGGVLYIQHRYSERKSSEHPEPPASPESDATKPKEEQEECCGMHITCEKDSLLAAVSEKIEYYDDEELDEYKGRQPGDYTDAEIEQFRDVLLTLLPSDIAGWARSLQLRGISLPSDVRDELLLIVAEARR